VGVFTLSRQTELSLTEQEVVNGISEHMLSIAVHVSGTRRAPEFSSVVFVCCEHGFIVGSNPLVSIAIRLLEVSQVGGAYRLAAFSSCASDSALLTIVRVYKLYLLTCVLTLPSVL